MVVHLRFRALGVALLAVLPQVPNVMLHSLHVVVNLSPGELLGAVPAEVGSASAGDVVAGHGFLDDDPALFVRASLEEFGVLFNEVLGLNVCFLGFELSTTHTFMEYNFTV